MATDTRDDGFQEIQLNGKQLLFLFMAATVVSVVIFLCGVLVGRGAGSGRADLTRAAVTIDESTDPSPAAPVVVAAPDAVPDARLDYVERLERPAPPTESLEPTSPAMDPVEDGPSVAPMEAPSPDPSPLAGALPLSPSSAVPAEVPAGEWAVQVAALNDAADADALAKEWSAKGYPAYVVRPLSGTAVFRVRIGTFDTRREADSLASSLQKEERISPWVTR